MTFASLRGRWPAAAALLAGALALSACSAGSLGSSDSTPGGKTQITFLTNNDPNNVKTATAVVKAFETAIPDIDVKVDTRPGGGEGDNLVKTRLSTGDMADVFEYNSGSLFQAISPEKNLTPVTNEAWVADLDDTFKQVVTAGGKHLRRALGQRHRRRRALQHQGVLQARAQGPGDVGPVHGQQRQDQGRRPHRGRADLR